MPCQAMLVLPLDTLLLFLPGATRKFLSLAQACSHIVRQQTRAVLQSRP